MADEGDWTNPPASDGDPQADRTPDAAWWESLSGSADAASFEPAELLHEQLRVLAVSAREGEGESSLRARTLDAMARATSAMLNPDSWDEPFSPAIETARSRTVVPGDLDADELTLLAEALPL